MFIEIKAAKKQYGTGEAAVYALDGVDFSLEKGKLCVILVLCNSDFFGIEQIHGQLIRCGTCGNGDRCDYLVVGSKNPIAGEYKTVTDENGFLVSRKEN